MPFRRLKIRSNAIDITVYVVTISDTKAAFHGAQFRAYRDDLWTAPMSPLPRHMFTQHDACQTYKRCLLTAPHKKCFSKNLWQIILLSRQTNIPGASRRRSNRLDPEIKIKLDPLFRTDTSDSFTLYAGFKCSHNESRVPKFLACNASDT